MFDKAIQDKNQKFPHIIYLNHRKASSFSPLGLKPAKRQGFHLESSNLGWE